MTSGETFMSITTRSSPMPTRREFLTAQPLREALDRAAEEPAQSAFVPLAANTVRLGKVAMASDFEVILNPDARKRLGAASDALAMIDQLEEQMSVFRPQSELSRLNDRAADEPVAVEKRLFDLLRETVDHATELESAFDPTAGPLVALWRHCRRERRIPTEEELEEARARIGCGDVEFDSRSQTIRFRRPGVELNLNAIGKGYALDRAAELLASGGSSWLIHGGHSSILAAGSLAGGNGWPIALRHPLFPNRQLATLLLKDRGISTSGSGVQFYQVGEKRYGHLIDPRTGWPAEGMLTVTVLAPTAARAEALSTAFFVLGVEKARTYCHNHREVAALLIPAPRDGERLKPVVCGIPETDLIWTPDPASGHGSTYHP
jgi:FAD:protein FMN transferase